jgi:hypothetical protein
MSNPCHACHRVDLRYCACCQGGRARVDDSDVDEYREELREQASHAAEDREANQRRLGMLDGTAGQWWGRGE